MRNTLDRWIARATARAQQIDESTLRVIDDVFCWLAWGLVATVSWILFAQWVVS